MHTEPEKQAAFWNARAKTFPAATSEQNREKMLRRLAHVPEAAYPRAGQRCLDIGAGTGVFSLWAAEQGAAVTAVDVSPGMLAELKINAGERKIETVEAPWQQIDPKERGWENAFDTVIAQMVPGFRAAADFARMEACCRGWCVFVGWGHKREDPWLQAVFAAHDLPWQVPFGLPAALELLATLGRHPEPTWIEDSWTHTPRCDGHRRRLRAFVGPRRRTGPGPPRGARRRDVSWSGRDQRRRRGRDRRHCLATASAVTETSVFIGDRSRHARCHWLLCG